MRNSVMTYCDEITKHLKVLHNNHSNKIYIYLRRLTFVI